jgi:serine phosphatase RsbU (regulator of sigma subunit)
MSFTTVLGRLKKLENPYPGLRPFEANEAHLFFGRDQQISALVTRLERSQFVAVVGVSSSGKSSVVRAGLIPALLRGQIADWTSSWRVVITRPAGAPFANLAEKLREAGLDPAPLQETSYGLIHTVRQLPKRKNLLLVVDQFEELFRYKEEEPATEEAHRDRERLATEANDFVQVLLTATRQPSPVYVVITMRSDYLGDCAEFRDFPEVLNESQYLLPRLTREQRRQAIEYPLGEISISPALVQQMLNDVGEEPDQLPILQHALMRTWDIWHRSDPDHKRGIEVRDYKLSGGFQNALDKHANELLRSTRSNFAATIFKRLTARGPNNRERRDPSRLSELWRLCGARNQEQAAEVTAVVNHYRKREASFLLPFSGELRPDTYIDITHESLLRQWAMLRDRWLPEEAESAKTLLNLVTRARNWKIGLDLGDARQWDEHRNPNSVWAEHYADKDALVDVAEFIKASEAAERTDVNAAMARYQQELEIAYQIQQQLMTVTLPELPYAGIRALSRPCHSVGGDFFDVVQTEKGLAFVVADTSGKGVSAAMLASSLQAMFYSQLSHNLPLAEIVSSVNRFLCDKTIDKYATLVVAQLLPNGDLEYLNAGHVQPLILSGNSAEGLPFSPSEERFQYSNLPVGLVRDAHYRSERIRLHPGDRLVIVSDGITETLNEQEELFGEERLIKAALEGFSGIELALDNFRGTAPLSDDWTLLEVTYRR